MFTKYLLFILFLVGFGLHSQTVGLMQHSSGTLDDGYILFAPISSTNTYLIDKCGKQVKTWPSTYRPGQSVYVLPDGTLLRSGNANNTTFNAGGKGGIIQKIDWSGNVTWNYTISSSLECQHHDIKALPNGNILAIVWESKTNIEAIAQGRNAAFVPTTLWSEKIIEIQQTGLTTGNVVWEWHLWDHLIQDFDNSKPNFGSINSNPQLVNINFNASATNTDWIHLNSIDFNPTLNQIVVSSHAFEEVWIIDHSTSSAQAASHSGGNSDKGGDILYRWGNPQAYNSGTAVNKKLFGQHNAYWIENGFPYQNQIMIFNNGNGRTGGNYSTVEIISPPVNGFNYASVLPYGPSFASWIYNDGNPNSIYAQNISGAQQLSNGNVLLCDGPLGTFREVNNSGTTVWKYVNPVNNLGAINQGATPTQNIVFRCTFYPSNYSGFSGQTLLGENTIENSNTVSSTCNLTLDIANFTNSDEIFIYPNPVMDYVTINFKNLTLINSKVDLLNSLGQIISSNIITSTEQKINVSNLDSGIYFIQINNDDIGKTYKIIVQ